MLRFSVVLEWKWDFALLQPALVRRDSAALPHSLARNMSTMPSPKAKTKWVISRRVLTRDTHFAINCRELKCLHWSRSGIWAHPFVMQNGNSVKLSYLDLTWVSRLVSVDSFWWPFSAWLGFWYTSAQYKGKKAKPVPHDWSSHQLHSPTQWVDVSQVGKEVRNQLWHGNHPELHPLKSLKTPLTGVCKGSLYLFYP